MSTPLFSVAVTATRRPHATPTAMASVPAPSFSERSSTVPPSGHAPGCPSPASAHPSSSGSFISSSVSMRPSPAGSELYR